MGAASWTNLEDTMTFDFYPGVLHGGWDMNSILMNNL